MMDTSCLAKEIHGERPFRLRIAPVVSILTQPVGQSRKFSVTLDGVNVPVPVVDHVSEDCVGESVWVADWPGGRKLVIANYGGLDRHTNLETLNVNSGAGSTVRVTGTDGVAQVILDSGGTTGTMDPRILMRFAGVTRWGFVGDESDPKRLKIQRSDSGGSVVDSPIELHQDGKVLINGNLTQRGVASGTTSTAGNLIITFPTAFTSAPNVKVTPIEISNASPTTTQVVDVTTTQMRVRWWIDATRQESVSVTCHWEATGPI